MAERLERWNCTLEALSLFKVITASWIYVLCSPEFISLATLVKPTGLPPACWDE